MSSTYLVFSGFLAKTLYAFLISPIHSVCLAFLILLDVAKYLTNWLIKSLRTFFQHISVVKKLLTRVYPKVSGLSR